MRRIAMGVTELSDSTRRTDCWAENLRVSYLHCLCLLFRLLRVLSAVHGHDLATLPRICLDSGVGTSTRRRLDRQRVFVTYSIVLFVA